VNKQSRKASCRELCGKDSIAYVSLHVSSAAGLLAASRVGKCWKFVGRVSLRTKSPTKKKTPSQNQSNVTVLS